MGPERPPLKKQFVSVSPPVLRLNTLVCAAPGNGKPQAAAKEYVPKFKMADWSFAVEYQPFVVLTFPYPPQGVTLSNDSE